MHEIEVAERILVRLCQQLGKLVGQGGFDVLFARALVLSRRGHPVLDGVTAGPGGTLVGLAGASNDQIVLGAAGMAIIAQFIELLIMLIGEDLGRRLVGDVWPEAVEEED